jgi:OFA family oxalate/formate antiporter-like MFS transporter
VATAPAPQHDSVPRAWPFKRTYYGWAIVFASFAASLGEVPVFGPVLGVFIKPMQEELGWSRATIAIGFSIGSMSGSAATVIVGRLVDRYGARLIVAIAGVLITAALLGMASMNEPWQFWALFGVGRGSAIAGVEIGTSVAVSNWFYRKRARALAIKGIGQRLGQTLVPLMVFAVMAASDWRTAFVAMAALASIVIIIPALLFIRRQPEDMGLAPDGIVWPVGAAGQRTGGSDHEVSWTLSEAIRTRAFWLITFFSLGTPFVQGATNLHLVANFQDRGLSDALAVSVLSIFAAVSALALLPVGLMMERVHVRHAAMVMAVILVAAMAVISVADSYWEALVFATLFGVGTAMRNIIETLLMANYFGRDSLGAIKGFSAPFRMLSPLGAVLAGRISDLTGSYSIAFYIFMGVAAVMFVAITFATPPIKPGSIPGR